MFKLSLPLFMLSFFVAFTPAQQVETDRSESARNYVAKVRPSRIKSLGKGKFEFTYDLKEFKTPQWYPSWARDVAIGHPYCIPSKQDVRTYLDSLPQEIKLTLDMSPCKIAIDCSPEYGNSLPLAPSFASCSKGDFLPSIDRLLWRGKISDDGLMAAFEYYDEYARKGLPRGAFYERLCVAALKKTDTTGATRKGARALVAKLWTARALAGDSLKPEISGNEEILSRIRDETKLLSRDEAKWKPISFYTWTKKLRYIFIRDRILHQPFIRDGLEAMLVLLAILDEDTLLKKTYLHDADRLATLTNPPTYNYAEIVTRACRDRSFSSILADSVRLEKLKEGLKDLDPLKISLVPPAFSPEDAFMKSVVRAAAKPVEVMAPYIAAIKSRNVNLHPGPAGSWYGHQQYALEPLLLPDSLRESEKISRSPWYEKKLERTFASLYAAHRETHAKDEIIGGLLGGSFPSYINRIALMILPVNRLEPLPEVYRRTSAAYFRLAAIMKANYKGAALKGMRPDTSGASLDIFKEVSYLCKLYYGFYLLSCEDIGLTPVKKPGDSDSALRLAKNYLSKLSNDKELKQDIRFMLPIFQISDTGYDSTLHWGVDGIDTSQSIKISYSKNPSIDFGANNPGLFILMKTGLTKKIATADFFEITLAGKNALNRDEFRELADKAGNIRGKIKEALEK